MLGSGNARDDEYLGLFHYYSLADDTARPGGLNARFCYSFLSLVEYSLTVVKTDRGVEQLPDVVQDT